ncbi:unknown [Clostridium sp. CAG:277]|nr:unknown [Clostridium sp. CAG:277]
MTKFEFLGDLSRLIADLPQEEIEQAMEYYEDYFADAGPEKEQEIIRDFISPAYIAEQLREASLQRQKAAAQASVQEEEKQAAAARAQAAASKPPVYSRKLAAQAQKNASMATSTGFVTQTPTVKTKSQVSPAQAAASIATAPISGQAVSTPTMTSGASAAPVTPGNPVPPQPQNAPTIQRPQTFGQAGTASQAAAASIAATPTPAQAAASLSGAQTPAQAAASLSGTQTPAQAAVQASASSEQPSKASSMRNSIFRDDTEEDKKKAEEELAKRNKTKVDIKSINSTTSKVNKKQSKAEAKRNAAIEKANNAERYSSSKKLVIGIVLLITCPIWLTLLGVILGVFLLGVCAVAGCILAGIGCFAASLSSIALTLLALLSVQIPTGIFTLGSVLFLFAAGCGLCFLGYKLATRILPGAYFSIKVLFNGIKARLARLALK